MEQPQLPVRARVFLALVVAATGLTAGLLLPRLSFDTPGWGAFLVLLSLVAVAQLASVRTPRGFSFVVSGTALVALALLVPPELAVLAGLGPLVRRVFWHPWARVVFNACSTALAVTAASAAARGIMDGSGGARFALAGLAATAVYAVVRTVLVLGISSLHEGVQVGLRTLWIEFLLPETTLAALGVVVAWLWDTNALLVPFALVALALLTRALHVPQLEEAARVDPKTGLVNARHFQQVFLEELARAARFKRPLALIVADLDYLREINNTHGHLAGDAVLQGIADVFRAQLRRMDTAARFGGEEFCLLLPEATRRQAVEIAERIRAAVAQHDFDGVQATISLGVAGFPEDGTAGEELLRRADEALYQAKAAGRNCVRPAELAPVA